MASTTYPISLVSRPNYASNLIFNGTIVNSGAATTYCKLPAIKYYAYATSDINLQIGSKTFSLFSGNLTEINLSASDGTQNFATFANTANTTWSAKILPASIDSYSIKYGGENFLIARSNNSNYYISTNGISWTQKTWPSSNYGTMATYGVGSWLVHDGANPSHSYSSTDLITWITATTPFNGSVYSARYLNEKYFATYAGNLGFSTDGIAWTTVTLPYSGLWMDVAYGNNTYVATTFNSNIAASSTDGISWTQRTMPASGLWYTTVYGNGMFVSVNANSGSGTGAISTDGITWTSKQFANGTYFYSVEYGNGIFMAVGTRVLSTSMAATSTNGITWTAMTMPSGNWYRVAYGNGSFVAHQVNGTTTNTIAVASATPATTTQFLLYKRSGETY